MSGANSPLFLHSSPLPHLTRTPDDEVPVLVQAAQEVEALDPAFDSFLVSHKHAFLDVFERQVDLIRSRSQAFEDGHVTVYDKTLLVLTLNGKSLTNPAAVKFYCKEYMNIDIGARDATQEWTAKLQQTAQVPGTLQQELSAGRTSTAPKDAGEKRARLLPVDPNLRKDMEPRLAVLWSVYETARAEYLAVIDKDDTDTAAKRAKFLRDTAENILLYLENRIADPLMIAELQGTFNHAKNTAVCLSGGKKRKFDPSEMDKVKGTPRGPSLPYKKEKYRVASGGTDAAGAYKHHHQNHSDVLSGYAAAAAAAAAGGEMMTSSYGWASSDLPPSGHGHPHRARYFDTHPYQDLHVPPLGYVSAAAPSQDPRRSFDHIEGEYGAGSGPPYNAAVSSVLPARGLSGSRTRVPSDDERGSPALSHYQDSLGRGREKSPSPSPPRPASPQRDHRRRRDRPMAREDRSRSRSRSRRRRSVSPANNHRGRGDLYAKIDRAYPRDRSRHRPRSVSPATHHRGGRAGGRGRRRHDKIDRAYSRDRDQTREFDRDRPQIPPMHGRGHRLVDSYVPARDGSRGRDRGRVRSRGRSRSRTHRQRGGAS